ncbi:hypothetical protein [Paenibacillus abyssi]|nr:hypothetical protein [Paenibacillus abyssi]
MASIKMYEILRSIRLHPFLRRFTDIDRVTPEESRKIDDKFTK